MLEYTWQSLLIALVQSVGLWRILAAVVAAAGVVVGAAIRWGAVG